MYDWTDDFAIQAIQSFPSLRHYIMQCLDMGDYEQMITLLLNLEFDGRKDA
jgi:hypothetical protein